VELGPAGFAVAREFDRLPWQHLMFFRATAQDPAGKTGGFPR
jgi:hypothetical protein